MAELPKRLSLDLSDALSGNTNKLAYFFQGARLSPHVSLVPPPFLWQGGNEFFRMVRGGVFASHPEPKAQQKHQLFPFV